MFKDSKDMFKDINWNIAKFVCELPAQNGQLALLLLELHVNLVPGAHTWALAYDCAYIKGMNIRPLSNEQEAGGVLWLVHDLKAHEENAVALSAEAVFVQHMALQTHTAPHYRWYSTFLKHENTSCKPKPPRFRMGRNRVFILVRPILRKVKWHFKSIISNVSCLVSELVIFKLWKFF